MKKWFKKIQKNFKSHRSRLNKAVKSTQEINVVPRIIIVLDIFVSYLKYGVNCDEYRILDFYNVAEEKRNTYMTKSRHDSIVKPKKYYGKFTRKKLYDVFNAYLNRNVYEIKELSFKEFEILSLKEKTLVFRDNTIEKEESKILNINDFRAPGFMLDKVKSMEYVEEYKKSHKDLNKLNPGGNSIVSITTYTNNGEVNFVSSKLTLEFPDNETKLKNVIDVDSGIVVGKFMDSNKNLYIANPNTGENLLDFKVPGFEEVKQLAIKCALKYGDVKEIEWNFGITDSRIMFLSANPWKDYIFVQMEEYLKGKNGLMPIYKKIK